jgi:hypothetical protein
VSRGDRGRDRGNERGRRPRLRPPRCGHSRTRGEIDGKAVERFSVVSGFAILDRDLTQAAAELTPTMKVKREVVYERYGDTLERLYA